VDKAHAASERHLVAQLDAEQDRLRTPTHVIDQRDAMTPRPHAEAPQHENRERIIRQQLAPGPPFRFGGRHRTIEVGTVLGHGREEWHTGALDGATVLPAPRSDVRGIAY